MRGPGHSLPRLPATPRRTTAGCRRFSFTSTFLGPHRPRYRLATNGSHPWCYDGPPREADPFRRPACASSSHRQRNRPRRCIVPHGESFRPTRALLITIRSSCDLQAQDAASALAHQLRAFGAGDAAPGVDEPGGEHLLLELLGEQGAQHPAAEPRVQLVPVRDRALHHVLPVHLPPCRRRLNGRGAAARDTVDLGDQRGLCTGWPAAAPTLDASTRLGNPDLPPHAHQRIAGALALARPRHIGGPRRRSMSPAPLNHCMMKSSSRDSLLGIGAHGVAA